MQLRRLLKGVIIKMAEFGNNYLIEGNAGSPIFVEGAARFSGRL